VLRVHSVGQGEESVSETIVIDAVGDYGA
jgi:hypothetical protein